MSMARPVPENPSEQGIAKASTSMCIPQEAQCPVRKWYFTKQEIEDSPSRRDGISTKKESHLRSLYCSFLQEIGMKLKVPQLTISSAMMLCHQFYMRQSHAKNGWQTVATASIFLACKAEDTPRYLNDVVVVAYEMVHKFDSSALHRIRQKEFLNKQKELILVAERLLLSTIGFDLDIQLPYKILVAALKRLDLLPDLAKAAWSFVNDWLRTSLCLQYKPHYIAAGSVALAANFQKVKLPKEKGKVWWLEFDVTPKQLDEVIQRMHSMFKPLPAKTGKAVQPEILFDHSEKAMPLSPDVQGDQGQILVRLKLPRSSLSSEDPSQDQDQNLTLTPVTEDPHDPVQPAKPSEDPDVPGGQHHDPDPVMPLSPIVVHLKRHRSSLFEDPSHDQNLTPVTEDSDVAKRPRSSLSSEHPDIQGGKHQDPDPDPDPAKPLKPVSRTLKDILDEAGPLVSKERELEYAKIFAKRKEAEPITNRVTGFGGPINVVQSYEAKPITNRVMASFPEPLLGGRINVVQSYGPDTLAEAAAAGASKRTLRDTPLFGGCINLVESYGPDTVAETEAARASKRPFPDTPFWNTLDSLRRRSAENPKYCGKEAWKEFIERQRSTWGPCQICLKADDHMSLHCPYLDYVPEGASVGPGVELVCRGCGLKDKHPGMNWSKCAILKSCFICASDHWGTDCPRAKQHKTVPYNPTPFSDR